MRFRQVLFAFIRLCQCSGLCPLSVYGSAEAERSSIENKKCHFAILTAIIFTVQFILSIHYYIESEKSSLLNYFTLLVSLTIRIHAGMVLIESYANRSIQLQLLEKFDQIEEIFGEKLRIKMNVDRLRRRCGRFIVIWAATFFIFVLTVFLCGLLTSNWQTMFSLAMSITPLYTSTLFYMQLFVYLDLIKYNIETINDCLMKMQNLLSLEWDHLMVSQQRILEVATKTSDICKKLIHLRVCYCKTWEASTLINRCVRWSLLLGINNSFVLYVTNLYWILYSLIYFSPETSVQLVVFILWAVINMSHFVQFSMICNDIMEQVRRSKRHQVIYLISISKLILQSNRMLFLVHKISVDVKQTHLINLVNKT